MLPKLTQTNFRCDKSGPHHIHIDVFKKPNKMIIAIIIIIITPHVGRESVQLLWKTKKNKNIEQIIQAKFLEYVIMQVLEFIWE